MEQSFGMEVGQIPNCPITGMRDAGFGIRTKWYFNLADKDGVQSVAVAIAGKPGLVCLV
jgi:hypothetical protein